MHRNKTEVTTFGNPSIENAPNVKQKPIPKELSEILNHEGDLCEMFSEAELSTEYTKVTAGIASDKNSMDGYLKRYEKAIQRVKLLPENEKKNFPFDDASNVVLPFLFDAAADFNARSAPPLLERQDICHIKINGKDEIEIPPEAMAMIEQAMAAQGQEAAMQMHQQVITELEKQPTPKESRADRVADMINYDLTQGMPEWREQQDKALFLLPVAGMYFKKTYQCPIEEATKSELIWPDKLIYDHKADTFEAAPRKTFEFTMSRNDVITATRSGQMVAWEGLDEDTGTAEYQFQETHCEMDLDGDGYAEPYIGVISKIAGKFVSLQPRFDEEDVRMNDDKQVVKIDGEDFFSQTIFIPDPAGTCTGLGYGILMNDIFQIIDTNYNQMVDAGTLNNVAANSGFIRQGAKVGPRAGNRQKKGTIEMTMGKFTTW
jgi:chaperonin GroES